MMRRLLATDLDLNLDTLFEFGLARLLDGFERYFASLPAHPPR